MSKIISNNSDKIKIIELESEIEALRELIKSLKIFILEDEENINNLKTEIENLKKK
tara:strand:- start:1136 stop:1303 length:168 start_codon:yes stop_codon:yes gene_type:complete